MVRRHREAGDASGLIQALTHAISPKPVMHHPDRHRLVHLRDAALRQLADQATTEPARSGLLHWAAHQLPMVVTRQPTGTPAGVLHIGLPLPLQWGRLKLSFLVSSAAVQAHAAFPSLEAVNRTFALGQQPLLGALQVHGLQARVHGSHGWQALSGLAYVHRASDLDLLIQVSGNQQADRATQALLTCETDVLKLDGELLFPDGAAVAWREWAAWRSGKTAQYLIKTLHGAYLAPVDLGSHVPEVA
jgi:phosphoribosyl-dephospho-CoA transferase